MKILVTGGGGFLGTQICIRLKNRGFEVISYARGRYAFLEEKGVEQICGDIRDEAVLTTALDGVHAVIHVAAKVGVSGNKADYESINVGGTRLLLRLCRSLGVRSLVFTSSPSVVFDGKDQFGISEEAPYPKKYVAHYPRTKALAEQLVLAADSQELRTVALRPHLIWGPGDPHFVPRILRAANSGRLCFVGREEKFVDAVYIDNAAEAHVLALEKLLQAPERVSGKAFFITNHEPLPMQQLVNKILAAANVSPVNRHLPFWLAYTAGFIFEKLYKGLGMRGEPVITRFIALQLASHHWYDTYASSSALGYVPQVSMTEGFKRLSAWLKAERLS